MRHSTSAGILRARIRASTATAEIFDPFQHPRLALERSSAGAAIGARGERRLRRKRRRRAVARQQSNVAAQRSRRARVRSVACACRVRREGAREVEKHNGNGGCKVAKGGRRRNVREKDPRPSPRWFIWAAGGGEWD